MQSALNLVALDQVTHTAVNNGNWNDPETWKDGNVPDQNSKVHIPHGITVSYGNENTTRHDTVRVDGVLKFATAKSSQLLLDTMVVTHMGELVVGNETNPVRADQSVDIIFSSNTNIASSGDPMKLRRGLISMGKVTIVGAEKLDHVKLKQPALKGDNVLVLDLPSGHSQPEGWKIGDRLVLGGTGFKYGGSDADNSRFQDEVLEITQINGNTIRFRNLDIKSGDDTVLRFHHQLPDVAESKDLNLYVANTSRNITFQSENGEQTAINRRGHIMFMHNPNVIVKNSGFIGLGRSDKTKVVDDPMQNVDGSVGTGTNPRGRYSIHLHHMKSENTLTGQSVILSGNAVVNNPGWGIVAHSSKATIKDNVVFDVVGSGIVAEGGDEQGWWENNIVIKTTGVSHSNVLQTLDDHDRLFDHGFQGEGYWVHGAGQVVLRDNIAISSNEAGITIYGDSLDNDDIRDVETIAVENLPQHLRSIAKPGQDFVDVTDVPLRDFNGFESYNAKVGLKVWGHMSNFDGELELSSPDVETAHNQRSTIANFKLWGNRWRGLSVPYSTQVDFKDGIILGNLENPKNTGVFNNEFSFNNKFENLTVKGFAEGFKVPTNGRVGSEKGFLKTELTNSTFSNNLKTFGRVEQRTLGNAGDFPKDFVLKGNTFTTTQLNQSPISNFSSKNAGGLGVTFDGSASRDPDSPLATASKGIVAYEWDFNNDGTIDATGRNAHHRFYTPGQKTIKLTVWDDQGISSTRTQSIEVRSTNHQNPFINGNFAQDQSYLGVWESNSQWANQGWYASKGVTLDSAGFSVLSSPNYAGGSLGQVIYNNQVHQGAQQLKFRLKNLEGSQSFAYWRNNEINIQLWGVNGQFNNDGFLTSGPKQVGTLPFEAKRLFAETIGGREQERESFDWRNFNRNVNLGQGYQFLLLQVNTRATKDQGDFVAIDNFSLTSDQGNGIEPAPAPAPAPSPDTQSPNDIIVGTTQADKLFGYRGEDQLVGNAGNDVLIGGPGNDTLVGGSGDDRLIGATRASEGQDVDRLIGGAGRDRFIISNRHHDFYVNPQSSNSSGYAWIHDFNLSEDTISLKGSAARYSLDAQVINGKSGTAILQTSEGLSNDTNDMIGFIEGQSTLSLNASYFQYS